MDRAAQAMQEVLVKLKKKAEANQSTASTPQATKNYECSKCQDKKVVPSRIENGVQFYEQCSCHKDRKVKRLFNSSEISEEFKKASFSQFQTEGKPPIVKKAFDLCRKYYKDFPQIRKERVNSLMLLGQPGSGKTLLLTALSNNLMEKRKVSVHYFPYVEGFNDLKDDFDQLEKKMHRMKHADVLLIDDLFKPSRGEPRATAWQLEQIYAVVNYRYLNHLPILVSSELSLDQLVYLDEALATRLIEMAAKPKIPGEPDRNYLLSIKGDPKELNHRVQGLL